MTSSPSRETFRFGDFELDLAAYELRRHGRAVKINRQTMDVLILLVQHRRELVSRQDIVDRLWGANVFVDVDTGVNTAISKARQALRDSAEAAAFVETVPGKGYRFIAEVEVVARHGPSAGAPVSIEPQAPATAEVADVTEGAESAEAPTPTATARRPQRSWVGIAIGLIALLGVVYAVTLTTRPNGLPGGLEPAGDISLAVLPFENIGSDPERAYLATGLTEETSALLARIDPGHLTIKGRALHYKGSTKTAAEIGAELGVDYLLEGGMRAEGDRVRATATLIRVRDQAHVWSQTFDRETQSLLALQQELGAAIAEQVRSTLSSRVRSLPPRQTQNAAAYEAYLKARYLESRRTPATNRQAIQEYQRAIALDPDYALAWAGLGIVYTGATVNADADPAAMGPLAREAAAQALRANPDLAESQLAQGYVHWLLDWDWTASEAALRRAVELDPSNAFAQMVLGHVLSQMGRPGDAEAFMQRARDLEPLEPVEVALSAQVAFQNRHGPAAVDFARRAVAMDSAFWIGSMQLAQALDPVGQTEEALAALADAARFSAGNSKTSSLRGYILSRAGRSAEAGAVLRQLEDDAGRRYVPPFAMALVCAGLGERDQMFDWLEKAYAARDVHLIYLPVDPKWDPFRQDPRFEALLTRAGFATAR